MDDRKQRLAERLAALRGRPDPLGLTDDRDFAEAAADLARDRYLEDRSDAALRAWLDALAFALSRGSTPDSLEPHRELLVTAQPMPKSEMRHSHERILRVLAGPASIAGHVVVTRVRKLWDESRAEEAAARVATVTGGTWREAVPVYGHALDVRRALRRKGGEASATPQADRSSSKSPDE